MDKLFTLGIFCYGDYPDLSIRAVESIIETANRSPDKERNFSLSVGAVCCCKKTLNCLREYYDKGEIDLLIETTEDLLLAPMMRLFLEEVESKYFLWMEDQDYVKPGWDVALQEFIQSKGTFDLSGAPFTSERSIFYKRLLKQRPWFISFERFNGEVKSSFMERNCFLVKTEYVRRHNYPDKGMGKWNQDLFLGDLLHQQGGSVHILDDAFESKLERSDVMLDRLKAADIDFLKIDPVTGVRQGNCGGVDRTEREGKGKADQPERGTEKKQTSSEKRILTLGESKEQPKGIIEKEMGASNHVALSREARELRAKKKFGEAIEKLREALRLEPKDPNLYFELANTQRDMGETDLAVASLKRVLEIDPAYSGAFNDLGILMLQQNNFRKACHYFRKAVEYSPASVVAHLNLAHSLIRIGKEHEAVSTLEEALKENPEEVEIRLRLADELSSVGRVDEALLHYRIALNEKPEDAVIRHRRVMLLLSIGEYQQGWKEFESGRSLFRPGFEQPVWDGGDLTGKTILLICEEGLNDSLMFIRYVKEIQKKGGEVVVECQPLLKRLFSGISGAQVYCRGERRPNFDFYAQILSLPYLFGTTLETIPREIPYLPAPVPPTYQLKKCSPTSLKVGIVWQYRADPYEEGTRACQLNEFKELFLLPGISWFSLQYAMPEDDREFLKEQFQVEDLGCRLRGFTDLASAIDQLDLVITIDSNEAHLAGALGKKTWVLLKKGATWQWLRDREDSPWYPTFRLFRQKTGERWREVFKRMKVALKELIAEHYEFAADAEAEWVTPHNYAKPQQDRSAYEDD